MATSPDGILEAAFDPAQNLTRLVVDGGMWRVPGVLRTNQTTNPRPTSSARWRVSGGETVTFLANDRGKPALEYLDPVGEGGLYGDPQDNYQPALGQYAALGYDLCALDAQTADRMRVIWSGYSGDTPSVTSMVAPLERPRVNLCIDPRATAAARWSAAGTAYNITETMVTGATDGPTLPDGSKATTYARYTMGATGDGTNTWYGYSPVAPAGTPYPAGTKAVLAIYARPSRRQVNARLYGRAYGATGAIVDAQFGDYATLEAGQWTRLAMVHTSTQAIGGWLPYAHVSAPTWQPGDTMDVTAVLIEPFAETITPHFDAAMAATANVEPVWVGTPNASVSRGLRPYQRVVHATRLTAYDPAGYLRALIWPNPQVAYPGNGFRVREAVVAFADTEAAARDAVAAFFDGDTPQSGSIVRYWTGTSSASSSVEELVAGPVSRVLIERSSAGVPTEPVRNAAGVPAAGGWFLGYDDAAPMDTTVTYTVTALDAYGGVVGTASVTIDTSGAEWGLWLKAPGRPQLTCRVTFRGIGDRSSPTQGGIYQVPGGGSIPQWSGIDTESLTIELATETDTDRVRLDALLRAERVLLIQSGQPEEIPSGYYFVSVAPRSNPGQMRSDEEPYRVTTLELTATSAPVGEGQGFTGTTYETVRQTYATYADLLAGNATYFDVLAGEGT